MKTKKWWNLRENIAKFFSVNKLQHHNIIKKIRFDILDGVNELLTSSGYPVRDYELNAKKGLCKG